jgi:hypothetical protein
VTLRRDWIASPNYSGRGGSAVRLVVIHTAEGATTYQDLGAYFARSSSNVSSHVGIDDTAGVIGEYVSRSQKAWTQGDWNPLCDAAELCAFAAWTPAQWEAHPTMLSNAAQWIAEECRHYGIPIRKLSEGEVGAGAAGVCGHTDLPGQSHWDPGPNFPWQRVIDEANGRPAPAPIEEDQSNMVLTDPATGGVWVVQRDGAVFAYDKAPYLGGTNNPKMNADRKPCVGISSFENAHGQGYCLTLDFGDGAAGDRFRRYRFPRDGSARV